MDFPFLAPSSDQEERPGASFSSSILNCRSSEQHLACGGQGGEEFVTGVSEIIRLCTGKALCPQINLDPVFSEADFQLLLILPNCWCNQAAKESRFGGEGLDAKKEGASFLNWRWS